MTQSDATSRLIGPGLSRFLQQRPSAPPGSVCDMCAEQITEDHPHVVNLDGRRLMCTCRGCYLLFSAGGSGGGKYRQVPNSYAHDPEFTLTPAQWDGLQIPVSMAFFFHNSAIGEVVALYPSPAGATESTLPLDAWADIVEANPRLAAALARRRSGPGPQGVGRFRMFPGSDRRLLRTGRTGSETVEGLRWRPGDVVRSRHVLRGDPTCGRSKDDVDGQPGL